MRKNTKTIAVILMIAALFCMLSLGVSAASSQSSGKDDLSAVSEVSGAEQSAAEKDFYAQGEEGTLQPEIVQRLFDDFIKDERWTFLAWGLLNTLIITVFAMIVGILLGFMLAIIRVAYDKNGSQKKA